ncbi:MAG: sigma-70 family RNA polymerase sigma factor [Candidatus Sulfotelmatobacter sp.]
MKIINDNRPDFDAIVAPHLSDALTLARWLTKNRADAEDVVQEACLRAHRNLHTYNGGSAKGWLLAIVRNTAYTWLEKNRQITVSIDDPVGRYPVYDIPDREGETPETILITKGDESKLHAAIESLPAEFREALILRDVQGLGYKEIAQITAVPVGTVMSRLARARRRLITALAQEDRAGTS